MPSQNTPLKALVGPLLLLILSLIPVMAGGLRLFWLSSGVEVTPDNARFFADPLPVVLHILSATIFSVCGAFQFSSALRKHFLAWHRRVGRILVPAGLVAALSGLWMTLYYPPAEFDGAILFWTRVVAGTAMVASMLLGYLGVLRRDISAHRKWMIRGYALGVAAGTQALVHIPYFLVAGTPDELPRALLMAGGWIINIAVAEVIIRRIRLRDLRTLRRIGA